MLDKKKREREREREREGGHGRYTKRTHRNVEAPTRNKCNSDQKERGGPSKYKNKCNLAKRERGNTGGTPEKHALVWSPTRSVAVA